MIQCIGCCLLCKKTIFNASYSHLHDITLMKRNTSAGSMEMFSNEQSRITAFIFSDALKLLACLDLCLIGESCVKNRVYMAKICIYEVYLTCGLCKVNTTVSLCSG